MDRSGMRTEFMKNSTIHEKKQMSIINRDENDDGEMIVWQDKGR